MGQRALRIDMERELKSAAQQRRWTDEQINALIALLREHAGNCMRTDTPWRSPSTF